MYEHRIQITTQETNTLPLSSIPSLGYTSQNKRTADNTESSMAPVESTNEATRGAVASYPIAEVEFERVQTPFIIGIWILSASIAKIGEYKFLF